MQKSSDIINTVIGAGTRFKGAFTVKNSARIDGYVEGDVSSDQDVVIGEDGIVRGNISAKRIIIGGSVVGNVYASVKVIMEDRSSLTGNINTKVLRISTGALFNGSAVMLKYNVGLLNEQSLLPRNPSSETEPLFSETAPKIQN